MSTITRRNVGVFDLCKHFVGAVWAKTYGKVLLTSWVLNLIYLFGVRRRTRVEKIPKRKKKDSRKIKNNDLYDIISLITMKKGFFTGRLFRYFFFYVVSLCTRVMITVKLSDLGGDIAGYFGAKRFTKMFEGQARFGAFAILAAANTMTMKFLQKRVEFVLRDELNSILMTEYLEEKSIPFYHIPLQDAPARLTTDLRIFSGKIVHTCGHVLKPTIDVVNLGLILRGRLGFAPLACFLLFFGFSKKVLDRVHRSLDRSLKSMSAEQQRLEARAANHIGRLHHYREQVAMQRGNKRELRAILSSNASIQKHAYLTHRAKAFVDFQSNYILKFGGAMCAFSILIPNVYFDFENKMSASRIISFFMSSSNLLNAFAAATKDLAESLTELPEIRGLASRVMEVHREVRRIARTSMKKRFVEESKSDLVLSDVSVCPPLISNSSDDSDTKTRKTLIKNLDLRIRKGAHTVIRGQNGVGKSSLFRTILGLWTPADPSSNTKIKLPDSLFVLPQTSYFPSDASLRSQITYPEPAHTIEREKASALLKELGLGDIETRYGLDGEVDVDWTNELSGGQKQRLAWCRLFFRSPEFAFLDESASAVSKDIAIRLYKWAKKRGITLISISHSDEIDNVHDNALDLELDGQYKFLSLGGNLQ